VKFELKVPYLRLKCCTFDRKFSTRHFVLEEFKFNPEYIFFLFLLRRSEGIAPLLIFERKIFRRIYGPKYEDGEWKIRTNRELEESNKGGNIVNWIKGQMISWLGHLERMEEDKKNKKIFTEELEGTRRRGRPRKTWREEVERNLQVLGVRRWTELVIDREKWRGIVRQTKAHRGL
jgi:hypothetical protein